MKARIGMQTAFEWGYERGSQSSARVPVFDRRIQRMLESEPCEIGSALNDRHNVIMAAWLEGYDKALSDMLAEA